MKNLRILLITIISLAATACSSTYQTGASNPDDVYYSPKDAKQNPSSQTQATPPSSTSDNSINSSNSEQDNSSGYSQPSGQQQSSEQQNGEYSSSEKSTDSNGNTYVTNNFYNDDYYDYAYTSRLRRFYTPVYGYGYYDPFYTNLYWYDYNPYSWGVSIYLGYHWWAPSYCYYSPFCYGGFYDPWVSPYYGFYSPGYYGGYGYYNPYYYNSFDATSYYYGPRGSISTNGRTDREVRNAAFTGGRTSRTLGDKYVEAVNTGRIPKTQVSPAINNATSRPPVQNQTGRNTSIPAGTNPPTKGIITNKNETGRSPNNQPQNPTPGYQNPANNHSGRPGQNAVPSNNIHTQPGRNDAGGRPKESESPIRSAPETPRNNQMNNINIQPRQEQNNSRPVETPRNNPSPQQQAPQNNEQGRPRRMSSNESHQFSAPQINHSFGGNYSSGHSGSGNFSSGRSEGSRSSGGRNTSGGGNSNGRGKR